MSSLTQNTRLPTIPNFPGLSLIMIPDHASQSRIFVSDRFDIIFGRYGMFFLPLWHGSVVIARFSVVMTWFSAVMESFSIVMA